MKTLEDHIESCEFSRALQYRLTFQGRVETDLSEEATNPIFEEATRQVPFAVIKDGKEWLFVDLRAVVDGQEIVVASETVEIEPGKDAKELNISFDSSKVDTKEVADDQDNVIENAVNGTTSRRITLYISLNHSLTLFSPHSHAPRRETARHNGCDEAFVQARKALRPVRCCEREGCDWCHHQVSIYSFLYRMVPAAI